jgi:hypothetical protein
MLARWKYKFPFINLCQSAENFKISVVYFITNPFQERDTSERAELISSTLKENMSEVELINLQMDFIAGNESEWYEVLQFNVICAAFYYKTGVIKCV